MVPFKETITSKEELIEACKKGFEDYSNHRISKNDFCMYFGFVHGQAITSFYAGNYEQLLVDGGFNTGSSAYFAGGINAWRNLRDGKYVFPPFQNIPKRNIESTILKNSLSSYLPYLTALRTKPFMLLAGISGTGKSRIVREMAKACWTPEEDEYGKNCPRNFCMVQVKPNWHDSSDLIGYVSRINGEKYVVGPFLRFIAKAIKDPKRPYFLCLDEMNLAPVEQYFAEYLSVIESRKLQDGQIETDPIVPFENTEAYGSLIDQLFDSDEERKAYKTEEGGKRLTIPENLFVVGTVNMDETTFSFSRKVLDRAMTIEMNEVDLKGGLEAGGSAEFGYIGEDLMGDAAEGKDIYADNQALCATTSSLILAKSMRSLKARRSRLLIVRATSSCSMLSTGYILQPTPNYGRRWTR